MNQKRERRETIRLPGTARRILSLGFAGNDNLQGLAGKHRLFGWQWVMINRLVLCW